MGLWDKIKGVGKKIGNVATKAAPFVGMIPGVGTLLAAGIGAGGGLLAGKGLGGALKYGALGAAGNIGANLLGKIPGVGFLADRAAGGGGQPSAMQQGGPGGQQWTTDENGISFPTNLQPMANASGGGGPTDWTKILGAVGKYAPLAMGAAGAYQNAQAASQNRQLTEEQIAQARAAIARQQRLQDEVLAGMKQPVAAPDYSALFRTQNPFAQQNAQAGG